MADAELERSPEARLLAEQALVALLHALGDEPPAIFVLGGLVPQVLVGGQEPPVPSHLGTTDVDVLLVTHLTLDDDLGHVENALHKIGFRPVDGGWRWRGEIRGVPVKMEFLCDLDTRPEFELVHLNGCENLVAKNLRGTGYVADDWAGEILEARLDDGTVVTVTARFAQLGGYLLSKLVAARTRGVDKDYYDLAYVLLHNRAGGPREAAAELARGKLSGALVGLRSVMSEVRERYRTANGAGPSGFARQSLELNPEADEAALRADAVAAVKEFLDALEKQPRPAAG